VLRECEAEKTQYSSHRMIRFRCALLYCFKLHTNLKTICIFYDHLPLLSLLQYFTTFDFQTFCKTVIWWCEYISQRRFKLWRLQRSLWSKRNWKTLPRSKLVQLLCKADVQENMWNL